MWRQFVFASCPWSVPSMGAGRRSVCGQARRENECQLSNSDKIVVELVAITANIAEMMATALTPPGARRKIRPGPARRLAGGRIACASRAAVSSRSWREDTPNQNWIRQVIPACGSPRAAMRSIQAQAAQGTAAPRRPELPPGVKAIRISSNENPLGPGKAALDAITGKFPEAGRYPVQQLAGRQRPRPGALRPSSPPSPRMSSSAPARRRF